MILQNLTNNKSSNGKVKDLITKLYKNKDLSDTEFLYLLDNISKQDTEVLFEYARKARDPHYKNKVFLRGLIEFSNYCKKHCNYCGISLHNKDIKRYRLSLDEIMSSCKNGYELGFRTFVLQSGEDEYFSDDKIVEIVKTIKAEYPDCAITLSVGQKEKASYQKYFDAGAERYLLRHESADNEVYSYIHPKNDSMVARMNCLKWLKEIGFQTGAGFMVGLPKQTNATLLKDIRFLQELKPEMCGIGPFIAHSKTPLKDATSGTLIQSLVMVSIIRLVIPTTLMPATTALATLDKKGRELAVEAGANVLMPNLSPTENKKLYELYENKICLEDTANQCRFCIERKVNLHGYEVDMQRGDASGWKK